MSTCSVPPEEYDHEPRHPVTIKYGWWPRAYTAIGGSVINLPHPSIKWMFYSRTSYECLIRHEMGHANGWPANHPGERVVEMKQ